MTTPTEDRDWKKRFERMFVGRDIRPESIERFIEKEITTAEARGYERGRREAKGDNDDSYAIW